MYLKMHGYHSSEPMTFLGPGHEEIHQQRKSPMTHLTLTFEKTPNICSGANDFSHLLINCFVSRFCKTCSLQAKFCILIDSFAYSKSHEYFTSLVFYDNICVHEQMILFFLSPRISSRTWLESLQSFRDVRTSSTW